MKSLSGRVSLIVNVNLESLIFYYLCSFLLIDVVNGFLLKNFALPVSIGELARGLVFISLVFYLFRTKYSQLVLFCLLLITASTVYYSIRNIDYGIKPLFSEISFVIKPFSYVLMAFYSGLELSKRKRRRIVNANFYVFCGSIILSYFFGFGYSGYSDYYESSKGLFLGNNTTAIVGIVLGYYYLFIDRVLIKFAITAFAVFLLGSKTILIIGLYILIALISNLNFKVVLATIPIATVVFYQFGVGLVERYKARILIPYYHMRNNGITAEADLLGLYYYVSYERARVTDEIISFFQTRPSELLFGIGNYFSKYQLFGVTESAENDLMDILIKYGLLGVFFYLYFHFQFFKTSSRSTKGLLLFVISYSILGGHFIFSPMAYTLTAIFYTSADLISKEN